MPSAELTASALLIHIKLRFLVSLLKSKAVADKMRKGRKTTATTSTIDILPKNIKGEQIKNIISASNPMTNNTFASSFNIVPLDKRVIICFERMNS